MKKLYLAAGLALGAAVSGCSTVGTAPACDRQCLVSLTEGYFDALDARAPERAALADTARITENGQQALKIIDGQLHTIEAFIRYEPLGVQTGWPG